MNIHNNTRTVWRLVTHHAAPKEALEWAIENKRLAIGWGLIGDIKACQYTSQHDISKAINRFYPHLTTSRVGGVCLNDFCYNMHCHDLVILSTGRHRKLVMEVNGDYKYISNPEPFPLGDYQHQRKAKILSIDPDELWSFAGSKPMVGYSPFWPLVKCLNSVDAVTSAVLDTYISEVEGSYQEGAGRQVTVNAYERNSQARQRCIEIYKARCYVCGFDFRERYGDVGADFIHVHHLQRLADIRAQYVVDPARDLRPVCPNCHAIIHRRNPPYTIKEVKDMLR